jgi:DNA gyrase subunit B
MDMSAQPDEMYGADDLTHLEGLEAVRKRPGMYIGSTDSRGIVHLFTEIVDNATDEAGAGFAKNIEVTLHPDGSIEVADDGRGIPTGLHARSGLPGVILVLTRLHAGGKFGGSGYKASGGLHGVGASVTNALSTRFEATVKQNGQVHHVAFKHGVPGVFDGPGPNAKFTPKAGLHVLRKMKRGEKTGTSIRWWHDPRYFENGAHLIVEDVRTKMRNTAFLVPGVAYTFRNATEGAIAEESFSYPGGLADMVEFLAADADKAICAPIVIHGEGIYKENAADANGVMQSNVERRCEVEIALRWGTGYEGTVETFTNTIRNVHGGTHKKGFDRAAAKVLVEAIKGTRGLLKPKEDAPTLDDVLEGMTAVIHVHAPEPQFTSQTKDELSTAGVGRVTQQVVETHLKAWLNNKKTKAEVRTVLTKIVEAARVRQSQKVQKEQARRKTALEGASMPAKLVDCRSSDVNRSEVFIVEGDSALGTARRGRSSEYQALLPIRGKILNVQKASPSEAMKNAEIESIIQVLGAGMGRTFDLEQMRYGRVMLMADADVDGAHIRTLLLTLFLRYMRPVIESGRLYAAMPPLFKVTTKGRNAETHYVYSEAEMLATIARLEKAGKSVVTPVPRFKGLGEMNAEELWDTTMNPGTRSVRRITIEDAEAAEKAIDLAMGSRVEPRRDWIIASADQVDMDAIDA